MKRLTVLIIFILAINFVYSQKIRINRKDYDSLILEKDKLKNEVKELKDSIETLDKLKPRLETDNRKLNETNTRLETDNRTLNQTITRLETDNRTLNEAKARLETDNRTLNLTITRLETDNRTLNQTKTRLETDNRTLNLTITRLEGNDSTLTSEKNRLQQENQNIKKQLTKIIDEAVSNTTNSNEYDIKKADDLISLISTSVTYIGNKQNYINQLENYKSFASSMNFAVKVLSEPYSEVQCTSAINQLSNAKHISAKQKEEKDMYDRLLNNYCKWTQYCKVKHNEELIIYLPDNHKKMKEPIEEILDKINNEHYFYLYKELNKMKNNDGYRCNFPNVECK